MSIVVVAPKCKLDRLCCWRWQRERDDAAEGHSQDFVRVSMLDFRAKVMPVRRRRFYRYHPRPQGTGIRRDRFGSNAPCLSIFHLGPFKTLDNWDQLGTLTLRTVRVVVVPCRWCNFFPDFDSTSQACSAVKQGRRVPVGTSGWCSGQMLLLPCRLWIWIFWMVSRTCHEQLWICSVMFGFVRQGEVKLWSKVAWRQEIQGIDGIVHPEWAPDTSRYAMICQGIFAA